MNMQNMKDNGGRFDRCAFTLVELLVVIAIIGIFVAALLPAMQNSRETARQLQCNANLTRIVQGLSEYEFANGIFPPGTTSESGPIENKADGMHHNWIGAVLPFLDESTAAANLDPAISVYDDQHQMIRALPLSILSCPSDRGDAGKYPASNYGGVHHHLEAPIDESNMGVLYLNSKTTQQDIVDGLQYTFIAGEKAIEPCDTLGWMSGTRATLRNTGTPMNSDFCTKSANDPLYVGGFSSSHPYGALFAYANGKVSLITFEIDEVVFQHMANRADGELVNLEEAK